MKYCQITGVEMPSDRTQNLGRENDSSAEFPLKEFQARFKQFEKGLFCVDSYLRGAREGFERGRASGEETITYTFEKTISENFETALAAANAVKTLEAKLADLQAEIERFRSQLDTKT